MATSNSRRKPGARRYKDYSDNLLEVAIQLVQNKNISSYDAEKQFGIPRRTIINKVKKLHTKSVGCPHRLCKEDEEKIIEALIICGEYGSPLTRMDLRIIVHDYLKKNDKSAIFDNKMPGERWVRDFLARYKNRLTLRSTQNIKRSRAVKTIEEYEEYFENLKRSLTGVKAENIINYDETNLSDNPGSLKCIFKRGTKYPNKILNNSKTAISLMFAATASGDLFPPYVVYNSLNLWSNWCKQGPQGTRFNSTKSGWFDSKTFEDWFNTIILPWAQKVAEPKVLIGDNLSSQLNINIITKCQENNIRFIFLPPNSTHDTQPLDISFFRPLKRAWRNILLDWKTRHPSANSLNKEIFPELLLSLMDTININKTAIIRSGFTATGIYPLNPHKVLSKLPDYKENIAPRISIDETLLNYLKETRSPSNKVQKIRNRKINVRPGESVCTDDFTTIQHKNTQVRMELSSEIAPVGADQVESVDELSNTHQPRTIDMTISPGNIVNVNQNLYISKDGSLVQKSNGEPSNNEIIREHNLILSNILLRPPKKRKLNSRSSSSNSMSSFSLHESTDGPFLESCSDTETFNSDSFISTEEPIPIDDVAAIEKYVLVKFLGGKNSIYYVGKIVEMNDNEYTVKYLRKNSNGSFSWPLVDDVSTVTLLDIEKVLPKPQVGRRGELKFKIDSKIATSKIK